MQRAHSVNVVTPREATWEGGKGRQVNTGGGGGGKTATRVQPVTQRRVGKLHLLQKPPGPLLMAVFAATGDEGPNSRGLKRELIYGTLDEASIPPSCSLQEAYTLS